MEERADWWEFDDPFDDLVPSLLTAEQITNYARVVGLLTPFDDTCLKSTTYEVGISGNVYSWDENKTLKIVNVVEKGDNGVVLEKNSITFVETDVEFLLPHYIAMRFNLHIKLVHRGLLLGTGPIVDPGFRGRLLIPLHNLTSTPYTIDPNEKIIWIEFSKTLFGHKSLKKGYEAQEDPLCKRFPATKRRRTPRQYLDNANSGNPIMSSIAGFIYDVSNRLKTAERRVNGIGIIGMIALFLSLAGLFFASLTVYNNAISILRADETRRLELEARVKHLEECLTTLNQAPVDSRGVRC